MIVGFSGFGFPKAHGAAFGLLAYQSTWLRVHYGPEFLCSLLDEQPMGFYPPDALVHEAQRRGIEVLAPDVNHSAVGCTVTAEGAVRIGLGYVLGVRADEVAALVAEREAGGPFARWATSPRAPGAGRAGAGARWRGRAPATRSPAATRRASRVARRRVGAVGSSAPAIAGAAAARSPAARPAEGTQLALPLELPDAPGARAAAAAGSAMIADYATTGLTTGAHALGARCATGCAAEGAVASADLARLRHGARVGSAGSSSPASARAPPRASSSCCSRTRRGRSTWSCRPRSTSATAVVRTEPLVVAEGRLERHPAGGGAINVARRADARRSTAPSARAGRGQGLQPAGRRPSWHAGQAAPRRRGRTTSAPWRPAVQSFASGRRR